MSAAASELARRQPSREEVRRVAIDAAREGIPAFVRGVMAAAPVADVVRSAGGPVEFDIPPEVVRAYNKAGVLRVPDGSKCLAYLYQVGEAGGGSGEDASAVDVAILDQQGNIDEPSLLALARVLEIGDHLLMEQAMAQLPEARAAVLH